MRESTLLGKAELESFTHTSKTTVCKGCANRCHLTVNRFADGRRYISGNQCSKGLGIESSESLPNLHAWKRDYLNSLTPVRKNSISRGKLGIPMALSTYELAPL